MKITAITRYKHGELYAILQRIGWTQSELARKTGMHASQIGDIINLVRRPTAEQADAIQKAVGAVGEYLDVLSEWPETFGGLKRGYKREQTAEVKLENLIGNQEAMMIPALEAADTSGLDTALETIILELSPREQTVIKERFWSGKTLEAVAKKNKVSRERVRQIEYIALRKMRQPYRISKLTPHLAYGLES